MVFFDPTLLVRPNFHDLLVYIQASISNGGGGVVVVGGIGHVGKVESIF